MEPESQPEPVLNPPAPAAIYPQPYSSFWPLLIVIAGLIGWSGYQAFMSYTQGADLTADFAKAQPAITSAENARSRLYSLAQDLMQTSAHDPYAAQVAKEAHIQLKSSDSSTGH